MRRYALCLVCGLLLLPAWASGPEEPEPAPDVLAPEYWQGRSEQEVLEVFGEPKKRRSRGKNGKVLSYKIRFFVGYKVVSGKTVIDLENRIGPERPPFNQTVAVTVPTVGMGPAVGGKLKAKFVIDSEGYVSSAEIGPVKWKGQP